MPHLYCTAEQRQIYRITTANLRQNLLSTRHTVPGTVIGKQVAVDFAPLKRFTDIALQSLFRVSATHNSLLQTMIEHILPALPDEPVKNLKKLLEIYSELVALTQQPLTHPSVLERMQVWKTNAGLKKVVESMVV